MGSADSPGWMRDAEWGMSVPVGTGQDLVAEPVGGLGTPLDADGAIAALEE